MAGALANLTLDQPCNRTLLGVGNIVRLGTHNGMFLRIANDTVDGKGNRGVLPHFRVSMAENDSVLRFESVKTPGKFLRINKDHVVDVGPGGPACHLTVKDIAPGVVVLKGKHGTIGVGPDDMTKPADKVGEGKHAQLTVDAIIPVDMLGFSVGEVVRLKSSATDQYVRVKATGVDAIGGEGEWPWMEVGVVNGNVTLKGRKSGKFLAVDEKGQAIPGDAPTFFTPMFGGADRKIMLIANGHPDVTGSPFVLSPEGQPTTLKDAPNSKMSLTDRFIVNAPLAPMLFGLNPKQKLRLKNVSTGKCLRRADDGSANVQGGEGPLTVLIFHTGKTPLSAVFESAKTSGKTIRSSPDGSKIDGQGGVGGAHAQFQLINLGNNQVAIKTPAGFLHPDKAPKDAQAFDQACAFEILPVA